MSPLTLCFFFQMSPPTQTFLRTNLHIPRAEEQVFLDFLRDCSHVFNIRGPGCQQLYDDRDLEQAGCLLVMRGEY